MRTGNKDGTRARSRHKVSQERDRFVIRAQSRITAFADRRARIKDGAKQVETAKSAPKVSAREVSGRQMSGRRVFPRGTSRRGAAARRALGMLAASCALGAVCAASAVATPGIGSDPGTDSIESSAPRPGEVPRGTVVELSASQLGLIRIEPAAIHRFAVQSSMIGGIDFDQDRQLQVFTPYQGRIIALFGQMGDAVKRGEVLFTVDSADLLLAEATLIQTAGISDLTKGALTRARKLVPAGGGAQKDLDQAISDQQTAEGNYQAAYQALHIYGKEDEEIDRVVHNRKADPTLVVKSPIDGVITARNASPGLFIQPGVAPAPYTVADTTIKWLNANVSEVDERAFHVGQDVEARVFGLPDRVFRGRISVLGASIDSVTRRLTVRSEVKDPDDQLKPGMFATVTIRTGPPRLSVGLPLSGVVREGDGTMTAWVTTDRRHFEQRTLRVGLQQDGMDEITSGLRAGELVVTDGAVFVSNVVDAGPSN